MDENELAENYEKYFPKIYGYVMKRVGNREEAEDIVSQTFLKAVEYLESFDSKQGSFKSWLYKIATNVMIDYFRKFPLRKTESLEDHSDFPVTARNPHENVLSKDDRQIVFAAVSKLPKKYQQVINLKFYGDMNHEEIAETMGISLNNVAVSLHRALQKFQEIYNRLI